jgi:hypothetical protein
MDSSNLKAIRAVSWESIRARIAFLMLMEQEAILQETIMHLIPPL